MAGKIYFAPKILSGLDSEGLLEGALRVGYHLTPKVQIYLGYQNLRADFEGEGTRALDEDLRIGFEAQF